MNKFLLLLCFTLCGVTASAQQDAQFSQYMFNGLYINPAYAGYREQWNVHAFYRNQWTSFPGAPKTFSVAADGSANKGRVGLGLQVMNDKLGASNNTSFYGTYAYRIPVNEDGSHRLSIGVSGGFVQQHMDISLLSPTSTALDPVLVNGRKDAMLPDARAGIYYYTNTWFTGFSANNLLTHAFQHSDMLKEYLPLKPHLYFTLGGIFPLSPQLKLKPSLLVKEDMAGPTSVDVNAMALIQEKLWLGISYRSAYLKRNNLQSDLNQPSAMVFMADFVVSEKLRIGYAYDMTMNSTAANNYPTNELSLGYFFKHKDGRTIPAKYF